MNVVCCLKVNETGGWQLAGILFSDGRVGDRITQTGLRKLSAEHEY